MDKKIEKKIVNSSPDLKYYAFDWDDNIVHMPTEIILLDDKGNEVGMSTTDFAEYRTQIGKKPFNYKGKNIVSFAGNPFRYFRTEGDGQFIVDAMKAKKGPAFDDFKEAVNNGSIFSIITARGHHPETLKEAIYNYIIQGFGGIDRDELVKNLKKYRSFTKEEERDDNELIRIYLDLNKYYPVTFKDEKNVVNPEEAKVFAMQDFLDYIKEMAAILNKHAYLKSEIGNKFTPTKAMIGFSDDDVKNVEIMKKAFKDKPEVKTYSTAGGSKKKV